MIRLTIPRRGAIAVAVAVASGALVAGGAAAATPMPAHVYAPYFETWTADTINGVATASGARYFTLAFLETTGKTSCTLGWDGSKTQPVVADGRYAADIATLRVDGRRRDPVVRRLERRPGRHRDRRLVRERQRDRRGLRAGRHDLRRDAGSTWTSRAGR